MLGEKLNEGNFLVYAMHHYDNPQCHSVQEFEEDLKKFLYHIIVLYNIFGDAATNMLFHKIDESCWDSLITFLVYLGRMPDKYPEHGITLSEIVLDENIIATLRKI
jgi:hypothetical protein